MQQKPCTVRKMTKFFRKFIDERNHTAPGVCGTAIQNVLVVGVETADKNDNERY